MIKVTVNMNENTCKLGNYLLNDRGVVICSTVNPMTQDASTPRPTGLVAFYSGIDMKPRH